MKAYDSQEWKDLEVKLSKARAVERQAVKEFDNAYDKLSADDPKWLKVVDRQAKARQAVADVYTKMASLVDKLL